MQGLIELRDSHAPISFSPQRQCKAKNEDYVDLRRRLSPEAAMAFDVLDGIADAALGGIDEGLERIYEDVDGLLQEGRFDVVDELLRIVDIYRFFVVQMLAFISITFAARDELKAHAGFVARVREHLKRVEPARVEELLAGFE